MCTIPLFDHYTLRPLCTSDAHDIFTSIDTQREHLGRWLPFVATTTHPQQSHEVVAAMLAAPENPIFTIQAAESFAGLIGFKAANAATATIEIGYWLRAEHQHKGVMTAAVRRLCTYAFSQLGVQCIVIRCAVDNHPSNAIPLRLAFRLDATEPHAELLSNGEYTDLHRYILEK